MRQNHILGHLDPLSKVYVVFHSLILSFFHRHAIPIQVLLHKVPKMNDANGKSRFNEGSPAYLPLLDRKQIEYFLLISRKMSRSIHS